MKIGTMVALGIGGVIVLVIADNGLTHFFGPKPTLGPGQVVSCGNSKCLKLEGVVGACTPTGQRPVSVTVTNIGNSPMQYRFDFNTDRIRLDGSQVAQTLESGGTRQHSLVTLKQDVPNTAISVVQISDPREPVAGDITKEQVLVGLSC